LAVAGSLDHLAQRPVKLKWPNDLMLGDRKLGGVLCEARWQGDALGWITVGVGVNVHNPIPEEMRSAACALPDNQAAVSVDRVAQTVVASLRRLDLGSGNLSAPELEEFARRDWLWGRKLSAPVEGTVSGLRADGMLLVCRSEGGEVPVSSGPLELAVPTRSR
jgi:BirA family biotin operon repressor/biotin-[acetyl-CoA-carboxylase] ligase